MKGADGDEYAAARERQEQSGRHQNAAVLAELPREHGVMTSKFSICSGDAGIDARQGTQVAVKPRVYRRLGLRLELRQGRERMLENRNLLCQRNPVEGRDLLVEIFQPEDGHVTLARSGGRGGGQGSAG